MGIRRSVAHKHMINTTVGIDRCDLEVPELRATYLLALKLAREMVGGELKFPGNTIPIYVKGFLKTTKNPKEYLDDDLPARLFITPHQRVAPLAPSTMDSRTPITVPMRPLTRETRPLQDDDADVYQVEYTVPDELEPNEVESLVRVQPERQPNNFLWHNCFDHENDNPGVSGTRHYFRHPVCPFESTNWISSEARVSIPTNENDDLLEEYHRRHYYKMQVKEIDVELKKLLAENTSLFKPHTVVMNSSKQIHRLCKLLEARQLWLCMQVSSSGYGINRSRTSTTNSDYSPSVFIRAPQLKSAKS